MNNEIIKAIEEGHIYDYIANNYYRMNQTELKNILLEYIYTFETALTDKTKDDKNKVVCYDANDIDDIKTELIENIKTRIE